METFSVLLAICEGILPLTGEFPSQRPVTLSFDVFFHMHLNKWLNKQSWGWWFEMPSCSLWRQCNAIPSWVSCGVSFVSIFEENYSLIKRFVDSHNSHLMACPWGPNMECFQWVQIFIWQDPGGPHVGPMNFAIWDMVLWHNMLMQIRVNIGSGNGLLPDGTKPLPEPMLTYHQCSPSTFSCGQYHKYCARYFSLQCVW